MIKRRVCALLATCAVVVGGVWGAPAAGAASTPTASTHSTTPTHASASSPRGSRSSATAHAQRACSTVARSGQASCLAVVRTDVTGHKGLFTPDIAPSGYGPADLQAAYGLSDGGTGQTVAIVDAYDDPNAEADLQTYRTQYGLPECSTANGCFSKVNQRGEQGSYPAGSPGWSQEISLDVDMVSAICPNCRILLVESDDNGFDNLGSAVNTAVALGAKFVSNSYGGPEDPSETTLDSAYYDHPGVVVTASSGDSGYGVSYPAASPHVTAVGGTSLAKDGSPRGWRESAWSGAGSGCSQYEPKPAWQQDTGCENRTVADVSAVADPATGVAVYDTFQSSGWAVFGGTSVAAPVIASTYALAGTPTTGSYPAQYPYDTALALNDVTSGSNGDCSPGYLCTGGPGYDGPTGLGTPSGLAAFKTGPHGQVSGTVTDAASGAQIPGAAVDVGQLHAIAGSDGSYHLRVPAGSYDVTVSAYGHRPVTVTGVTVPGDGTVTENFALDATPMATVSGTVRDGSGHGWPLYAKVQVADTPVAVYTDPVTGAYRLSVPQDGHYTIQIDPAYAGYQRATSDVTVGTGDVTHDVSVAVDAVSCVAPGYAAGYSGSTQPFDAATAPAGWTVRNAAGSTHGFEFDAPGGLPNNTGGSGNFAVAYPGYYGSFQDTQLLSPVLDLSADTSPVVQWNQDIADYEGSTADVDLSVDGGTTWTNIYRSSGLTSSGPNRQMVKVPEAAGKSHVQVRFHYTSDFAQWWWALDDVFIGNRVCQPVVGGLVVGAVTDSATGSGLNGATVTGPTTTTITAPTPDDPALADSLYHLFSPSGRQQFKTVATGYAAAKATTTVATNAVTRLNFALRSK